MTKEEAREILLNSEELRTEKENGVTFYAEVGEFCGESETSISFAVYHYTSESFLDKTYAFQYWVNKKTGDIGQASAPIPIERLQEIQQREHSQ